MTGPERSAFDGTSPFTVGLEEEVMLLDPETFDLADRAPEMLDRLGGAPGFKLELPRSQIEIITPPEGNVPAAIAHLAQSRAALAEAVAGEVRPAVAAVHPFAAPSGEVNDGERYDRTIAEHGPVARRQRVCALQVHVAVGGADRTLAVYNALREHLPAIAALAANGPVYGGDDTGFASVRPLIGGLLPRQSIPPAFASWDEFAAELRWGAAAGRVPDAGFWWWELRPHARHGTLELRVPDAQTTLGEAGAVAAVVQALVADLAARLDAGERAETARTWRIAENRWTACREGLDGTFADVRTAAPTPVREHLIALLDRLGPIAERLGSARELSDARDLVAENGALRQRSVFATDGARGLAAWLADRFTDR